MDNLIYVADDDAVTRKMVQFALEKEGFQVICFENGNLLYDAFQHKKCSLVILDVLMPGNDGFTIGTKIRQISNLPIIILTGQEADEDYIFGISLGFDAYLTKPFNPAKLIAHVKTLLTKAGLNKDLQSTKESSTITYADITIYPDKLTAHCNSKNFALTNIEFNLLVFMFTNQERAISREELLNKIWGFDTFVETRAVDDAIKRLRRKLTLAGSLVSIDTVWGFGFRVSTKTDPR